MEPLVSILIPAFNAETFIEATLKSALSQTWPRTEIIVVDDGSSDRTLSIARRFASPRVSVITQANQGASAARNKALSLSQGDFIQWLDADDLLAPDKIANQMAAAERYPDKRILFSSAWGSFFHRFERTNYCPTPLWEDLSKVEWLYRKLDQNLFMQTGVWLVSRELSSAAGPWDSRLSYDDDGEYFARVLLASNGIRFVPEAKAMYRLAGANRLSYIGQSNKKIESLFLSMQLHIQYLQSLEASDRVRAACVKYLQRNFITFHPWRRDLVNQLEQLATTLGGKLEAPKLPGTYAWIQKTLGWDFARQTQVRFALIRSSMVKTWDKALFQLEK
jgi:glycosyltransferase involved in cell wall biosynthesis